MISARSISLLKQFAFKKWGIAVIWYNCNRTTFAKVLHCSYHDYSSQAFSMESLKKFYNFDKELQNELENISHTILPSHSNSFADYICSSKILQSLVMLGVNLSFVESKSPEALKYLVTLDFHKDVKPKVQFLKNIGVTSKEFGEVLTKNISILNPQTHVDEFQESIDYLSSKKFKKEEITSIISRYPQILNVSVVKLDGTLGFYQHLPTNLQHRPIHFKASVLRSMILKCPRLVTADLEDVYSNIKILELSCEFTIAEIRALILQRPQILLLEIKKIQILYKFFANEMGLTNEQIARNAFVFDTRLKVIRPRHLYLKYLGRNIYDEDQPGYLALDKLVRSTDIEFCNNCELGPYSDYEDFLKTL